MEAGEVEETSERAGIKGIPYVFSNNCTIVVKMYAVIIINGNVYSLDEPLREEAKS